MGIKLQCQLKSRVKGMLALDARTFVAGHRGMVGSAIVRQLEASGHTNIITRTRTELDLTNQDHVSLFFEKELRQSGTILSKVQSPPPITLPDLALPIFIFVLLKNELL